MTYEQTSPSDMESSLPEDDFINANHHSSNYEARGRFAADRGSIPYWLHANDQHRLGGNWHSTWISQYDGHDNVPRQSHSRTSQPQLPFNPWDNGPFAAHHAAGPQLEPRPDQSPRIQPNDTNPFVLGIGPDQYPGVNPAPGLSQIQGMYPQSIPDDVAETVEPSEPNAGLYAGSNRYPAVPLLSYRMNGTPIGGHSSSRNDGGHLLSAPSYFASTGQSTPSYSAPTVSAQGSLNCRFCGKSFSHPSSCARHEASSAHQRENPTPNYLCRCRYATINKWNYKRHIEARREKSGCPTPDIHTHFSCVCAPFFPTEDVGEQLRHVVTCRVTPWRAGVPS